MPVLALGQGPGVGKVGVGEHLQGREGPGGDIFSGTILGTAEDASPGLAGLRVEDMGLEEKIRTVRPQR